MLSSVFSIVFIIMYFNCSAASRTNFQIKRFELCNHTQGVIKFHGNISQEKNGKHYITCTFITPIPWDDNLGGAISIQSKIGQHFMELFVIREKSLCKTANIYLGEFWYDFERAAQIPIKVCPIQPGRYNTHHAEVDFTKMSLQTFPFGHLRFILKAVDNKNIQANMLCLIIEVENLPN